jgi:hypothetical protein
VQIVEVLSHLYIQYSVQSTLQQQHGIMCHVSAMHALPVLQYYMLIASATHAQPTCAVKQLAKGLRCAAVVILRSVRMSCAFHILQSAIEELPLRSSYAPSEVTTSKSRVWTLWYRWKKKEPVLGSETLLVL